MTAKYFAILTNYGAAQLANAVALGTQMNISAMAVGDGGGTLPAPDPAQTKLVRETRRAAVNQVSIDEKNPNFIIAEQVIPENEGGWWIREIGLFDDTGGLIAVGNAPETYKPNLQEGSGRTQVIQMVLMVSSTQAITLKVDPSVVLATREYVTKSIDAAIQASEARAAQTYQPKGDYVTNPYLKLELLKKIDKADITQQLGNDTGKVVSQNLLATELGKKASVADANSKLAKDQNGADIPDKPKFIENLGLGGAAKSNVTQTTGASKTDVMSQDSVTKALSGKASGDNFVVHSTFSAMHSPNKRFRACMLDDGSFSVINAEAEGSPSTFSFTVNGEMLTGTVPVSRLTGLSSSMGSSTAAVMNQKGVTDAVNSTLGYKQTPHDMTSSRKTGTRYINGLPSPIYVSATFNAGSSPVRIAFLVDGERMDEASQAGSDHGVTVGAIVPPGSSYMASDLTSGAKLIRFMELK